MTDTENVLRQTFADRRRDAILANAAAAGRTREAIREIVIGKRRDALGNLIEIAAPVEPKADDEVHPAKFSGTFIAEINDHRAPAGFPITTYVVIHDGYNDRVNHLSIDLALLHAVAVRAGDITHTATAARFAARMLGVADTL